MQSCMILHRGPPSPCIITIIIITSTRPVLSAARQKFAQPYSPKPPYPGTLPHSQREPPTHSQSL